MVFKCEDEISKSGNTEGWCQTALLFLFVLHSKAKFLHSERKIRKQKRVRRQTPGCPSGVRQDSLKAPLKLGVLLKYASASRQRKV